MYCGSCRRWRSPTACSSRRSPLSVTRSTPCKSLPVNPAREKHTMTITTAPAPASTTSAPLELFDIDRLLDDDERDIAATVRKFVDTRLRPNIEGWFESATLPTELAKSSAIWACSACTWTATVAPAPTLSAADWHAWR